jgi:hypothetical protein
MRRYLLVFILLPLYLVITQGCFNDKAAEHERKWRLYLSKDSKLPYGNFLAYSSLKYYFPQTKIQTLAKSFRYNSIDDKMKYDSTGPSLLVLQGLDFYLSAEEWRSLKSFISSGNEVILFCSRLDDKIEKELKCYKRQPRRDEEQVNYSRSSAKENEAVLSMADDPHTQYGYKGRSLLGFFAFGQDTTTAVQDSNGVYFSSYADTLGYAHDQPDFIRYSLGGGHLTLHAAPLVLSNYFLLQDSNENYLASIWQSFPANVSGIYWNDYYKRRQESSGIGMLFNYPATRLAMLLAIATMLAYVLFEGKRKQRMIPIIPPLKNDSVSFVETVGRLYYNKGNHTNLAQKMIQRFMEWVRARYYLNTNVLNDEFTRQLTAKSGQPEAHVRALVDMIHEIKMGTAYIDDPYLYQLYVAIRLFYKNNP